MNDHADAARYAQSAGELLLSCATTTPVRRGRSAMPATHSRTATCSSCSPPSTPTDRVLSEESADDRRRLDADRVWIVDPLDGTREFTEPGRNDWAVHVALWERDRGLTAGAVALPAVGIVLSTAEPPVLPPVGDRPWRVIVSRSRAPVVARRVAHALDADVVYLGSAGAKAMAVVLGHADAYVHSGGQYEWDSAAPAAVALAAGLHASRLDGSPLEYNQSSTWLPDLVVCRPELADQVLKVTTG